MRMGMATDHGGFSLKEELLGQLRAAGHEVVDFGAHRLSEGDDYTEPNPAHEMPEISPRCSGSTCSAAAYQCPGCRAGGNRALFLAGGPPTGAVPPLALLAPLVLTTVTQLRAVGAVRGGDTGRSRGAQFPLGQWPRG